MRIKGCGRNGNRSVLEPRGRMPVVRAVLLISNVNSTFISCSTGGGPQACIFQTYSATKSIASNVNTEQLSPRSTPPRTTATIETCCNPLSATLDPALGTFSGIEKRLSAEWAIWFRMP